MIQTQKTIKVWMYNDTPIKYKKLISSTMHERDMVAFCPKSIGHPSNHPVIALLSKNCFSRLQQVVGNGYVYFFTNYSDEAKKLGSVNR